MKTIKIYPSLISAPLLSLQQTIEDLEPLCNGFHIDIMDNHFVPNLTWGPLFVNQIALACKKPLFVHIMADDVLGLIEKLKLKPQSIVAFHVETKQKIESIIAALKSKNLIPCITLNPSTPLTHIHDYLKQLPMVLLMSVNPGFSGQKFIDDSVERLEKLVEYRKQHSLLFEIAMDGGINEKNIALLAQKGCTSFCIASALFDAKDPKEILRKLSNIAQ